MQWLYESSDEAPELKGLGVLPGRVVRLKPDPTDDNGSVRRQPPVDVAQGGPELVEGPDLRIKVPHVGWNSLALVREDSVIAGVASGAQVYYTHSYVAPVTADTAAVTEHGQPFAAVVQRGRVAGVQFHPEKSGEVGLRILRNFCAF
jgi:glutamine amidotransferase